MHKKEKREKVLCREKECMLVKAGKRETPPATFVQQRSKWGLMREKVTVTNAQPAHRNSK